MSKRYFTSLLLLLALIGSMGWHSSLAQSGGEEYFNETGHWLKGEFLAKYYSAPDPILLYGYPTTSAFLSPTTNLMVQYFQKARFELHPEAREGQRVQLSLLGEYLYVRSEPAREINQSATCRYFSNDLKVCYDFLKFYDDHGGEAQFGLPVSNLERRNGVIVQHFQYARFEWHPEFQPGQRVWLSLLGYEYFYKIGENPNYLKAEPNPESAIQGVLALKMRAYPKDAITSLNGVQTIYVVVQDQTLLAVPGATIRLTVLLPSGEVKRYEADPTNENGMTRLTFPFTSDGVGNALVTVEAIRKPFSVVTTTSFRIWW
jgi:hypothetical protein